MCDLLWKVVSFIALFNFGAAAFFVIAAIADSLMVMWVCAWDACGVWFGVSRVYA